MKNCIECLAPLSARLFLNWGFLGPENRPVFREFRVAPDAILDTLMELRVSLLGYILELLQYLRIEFFDCLLNNSCRCKNLF